MEINRIFSKKAYSSTVQEKDMLKASNSKLEADSLLTFKEAEVKSFSWEAISDEDGLVEFIEKYGNKLNNKPSDINTQKPPAQDNEAPKENRPETPSAKLEETLTELGKIIDDSRHNKSENEKIFTRNELYLNIQNMMNSDNAEISAIGQTLYEVFSTLGVELPKNDGSLDSIIASNGGLYSNIIMNAIMNAIKGKEIDPETSTGDLKISYLDQQEGITLEELLALDKNGNGSIVDELKEILTDSNFIDTCKKMIQREKNRAANNELIYALNTDNNSEISVDEIFAQFGKNAIADLFRNDDGSVDRALLMALGGNMSKDGNYTISISALKKRLYDMDADRDGNITKEEVAKYKEGQWYRLVAYNTMMSEMERSNTNDGSFDSKFTITDIEKFIKNNPTANREQREFWSILTNITDAKLKSFIMKTLGDGSETVSISQFTSKLDTNGDMVVTRDELQKFIDETTQLYNSLTTMK